MFVCGAELAVQSQRRRTMVYARWKRRVFSRRLKVLSDSSGARSEGGRLFQVAGPNTAKLCWPVEVRTMKDRNQRRCPRGLLCPALLWVAQKADMCNSVGISACMAVTPIAHMFCKALFTLRTALRRHTSTHTRGRTATYVV